MKMTRSAWLQILIVAVFALAALLLVRLHNAGGATLPSDSTAAGHRLAEAWCKDCHAIDAATAAGRSERSPGFHGDRQSGIDHGAFAESILSDQPSQHAQSHHCARSGR